MFCFVWNRYVYDLEISPDMIPKPSDGEVECFYLWDMDEVCNFLFYYFFKKKVLFIYLFIYFCNIN